MTDKKATETTEKPKKGLTNREIWRAYPALLKLSEYTLPVRLSMRVAKQAGELEKAYTIIDKERVKLVKKHQIIDSDGKKRNITASDPEYSEFSEEFDILQDMVQYDNIKIEKSKLPEKITGTCEQCHHNQDVIFQIPAFILIPLQEKFVEVE